MDESQTDGGGQQGGISLGGGEEPEAEKPHEDTSGTSTSAKDHSGCHDHYDHGWHNQDWGYGQYPGCYSFDLEENSEWTKAKSKKSKKNEVKEEMASQRVGKNHSRDGFRGC